MALRINAKSHAVLPLASQVQFRMIGNGVPTGKRCDDKLGGTMKNAATTPDGRVSAIGPISGYLFATLADCYCIRSRYFSPLRVDDGMGGKGNCHDRKEKRQSGREGADDDSRDGQDEGKSGQVDMHGRFLA